MCGSTPAPATGRAALQQPDQVLGQRLASGAPAGVWLGVTDPQQQMGHPRQTGHFGQTERPAGSLSPPDRPPPPTGGFATFSSCFPGLCEGKPAALLPMSLSQPCLPVPSVGLTRILPHLYLGSQKDVLNKVCVQRSGGRR
ncbi:hypothetical protein P7K49_040173, partial [Saguinus oedipus]